MSGALVKLLLAPTLVGPCAQTVIDRMTGDCVFEAVTGPLIPAELVEPASPLPFLAGPPGDWQGWLMASGSDPGRRS